MTGNPTPPARREESNEGKLLRQSDAIMQDIQACLNEQDDRRREQMEEDLQPLCIMKQIEYHVQLAWGGPGYGFKLMRDANLKEFTSGVFYYAHWFTYDERSLSPSELDDVVRVFGLECIE